MGQVSESPDGGVGGRARARGAHLDASGQPSFNSPAADLNQLRNEAKRIAESAPGQAVHKAVLDRARALASAIEHDLGLPTTPDGLCYADLAVLLSQSK